MKIHFVGIGGIGMSGLARYFKAKGFTVTGSDLKASDLTRTLKHEGLHIVIGHRAKNVPKNADLVIYNRAIPLKNPELVAARRMLVPLIPLAEAIGRITKLHSTIAITGSHGKSTTTAFAGIMLMRAGLDPTILIGTKLKELGNKNVRIGGSPWLVLEADDYGAAIISYSPAIAVVTNIDREHLDFYKTFANLKNTFLKFLERTHEYGALILNRDDRVLLSLRKRIGAIAKKRHLTVIWYSLRDPAGRRVKEALSVPGEHNFSNALAVYKLGRLMEIPEKKILTALHAYHGAWRRMEYRGTFRGAPVYDDYAHHPTEIRATLKAFREKFPDKKIVCVFEPHHAKRLEMLFKEFTHAFDDADETLILPVYKVAGRDGKKARASKRNAHIPQGPDSPALVRAIQAKQPKKSIAYLSNPRNLKKAILALGNGNSSVIIMMGAGSISDQTTDLITSR